jgi:thiol-disulfide isomerase/thioredoxin
MTSSPEKPVTQSRPKGIFIALAIVACGAAVALYGIGRGGGNAGSASCAAAKPLLAAMAPHAKGDVAAVSVPRSTGTLGQVDFTGPDGKPLTLADFKGRTVLLNLWATWCVPCREEMPALNALQQKLGSDNFEVVAVNIDTNDAEKPKQWLKQHGIDHLTYYADPSAKIFQQLKAMGRGFGLPTSLIVGKHGCELGYLPGPAQWDSNDAAALIKAALGRS